MNGDERFSPYLRGIASAWNFAASGDTEMRLRGAGFEVGRCWLDASDRCSRASRAHSCARPYASALTWTGCPDGLRAPYMEAVLEVIAGPLTLDYVRLNISARRP